MASDFQHKRILGIDYGTKVVGLATYHWGNDPYPLIYGKIVVKSEDQVVQELLEVMDNEVIDVIVLGLPLFTDGTSSRMTEQVQKFAELLKKNLPANIELFTQDETLSSFEAQERMKQSPRYNFKVDPKQIDALAASIILEDFVKAQSCE